MRAEDYDKLTCVPLGLAGNTDSKRVLDRLLRSTAGLSYDPRGAPVFPMEVEERRTGLALASYRPGPRPAKGSKVVPLTDRREKKLVLRSNLNALLCGMTRAPHWKKEKVLCNSNFPSLDSECQLLFSNMRKQPCSVFVNFNVALFVLLPPERTHIPPGLCQRSLQYKFMISPHGVGLDCYRTYEALFLGMIPVVTASTLDSAYVGLPVVILNNWSELNPHILHNYWTTYRQQKFDFQRLYMPFWEAEVRRHRSNPNVRFDYRVTGCEGSEVA